MRIQIRPALLILSGHARRTAFSLVELLIVVTLLAILAGVAIPHISGNKTAVVEAKLRSDVNVLNHAVKMYLAEGGSLDGATTYSQVLAKLKTKSSAAVARRHVGPSTGRFVDPRLAARELTNSEASSKTPRAAWSSSEQKFVIANEGSGIGSFYFDDASAGVATTEENRQRSSMLFNRTDGWVWEWGTHTGATPLSPGDYALTDPAAPAPPSSAPPSSTPAPPSGGGGGSGTFIPPPEPLPTPTILPVGGLFSIALFPSSVVISANGAGAGSQLQYRLDSGTWQPYSSGFAVTPGTKVYARNYAIDTTRWITSPEDMEAYYRIVSNFSLLVIPEWSNMTGKENLVKTLLNLDPNLIKTTYGLPTQSGESPNYLEFRRTQTLVVPPDTDFTMGKISYYNGTVQNGTEATAVDLKLRIQILTPTLASGDATAHLTLWSSPNTDNDEESADYAQLENPVTDFTVQVGGITYALELRFANVRPEEGWTDGKKLYVYENFKGTADLIARFRSRN